MSIAWADVIAVVPSLSTVPAGLQGLALRFVDAQIDDDAWGDANTANDARIALAAHFAAVFSQPGVSPGMLASESLGPMSRSYATTMMSKSLLGTTKYGLMYLQMLELTPGALGFVP